MRVRALIGSTAVVALALVGCGDDETSTTSEAPQTTAEAATSTTDTTPDAATSVAPETTAFVPDVDVLGIDTDQPCSAISQSGELPETGFALHEVAALTIDPREGLELVGDEWVYESFFIDNAWFGSQWTEGCAIATETGRITGHEQSVMDFSVMHPPQALSLAHVFETEAGAEAFIARVVASSG